MSTKQSDLSRLSSASFDQQVALLRELFGFTRKEFGVILGVSEKTIQRWESGESSNPNQASQNALQALKTMAESLGDLFEPDVIKVWVDRENPALNGKRPRDFAKKPGGLFIMAHRLGAVGR